MINFKDESSADAIIMAVPKLLASQVCEETVILEPETGTYYSLNSVGSRIWELIQEPQSIREIKETILAEYEVEPQQCVREILALIEQLAAAGLIEVKDAALI